MSIKKYILAKSICFVNQTISAAAAAAVGASAARLGPLAGFPRPLGRWGLCAGNCGYQGYQGTMKGYRVPGLARVRGLHGHQGFPRTPVLPRAPGLPRAHSLPRVPGLPRAPGLSQASGLPRHCCLQGQCKHGAGNLHV